MAKVREGLIPNYQTDKKYLTLETKGAYTRAKKKNHCMPTGEVFPMFF